MVDRAEAQRRVNRIQAFREELALLTASGVVELTPEQQQAIEFHHRTVLQQLTVAYDVDPSEVAGTLSRGMRIAAFFAAVTLTAALYALVSRVWGRLDLPLQATLLCAFPLMALVGVELFARRERTLYVSSIFALVAFGAYWLAVGELGRLFNLPLTPPALWGGALFGLTLALPYGFRLVFGGGLVALLVALSGSAFYSAGVSWRAGIEHPEVLTASAFALSALSTSFARVHPGFAPVARVVAFGLGFAGLLALSSTGSLSLLPFRPAIVEGAYQALMLVACVGVLWFAIRRGWRESVYLAAGALTLFLFVRFVDWFWASLPRDVFFLLLAGIAFAWLFALRRLRARLVPLDAA